MSKTKAYVTPAELEAVQVLIKGGFNVRLFKRIDKLHTVERHYTLGRNTPLINKEKQDKAALKDEKRLDNGG